MYIFVYKEKEAIVPEDCRHFSDGLSDFLFGLYLSTYYNIKAGIKFRKKVAKKSVQKTGQNSEHCF